MVDNPLPNFPKFSPNEENPPSSPPLKEEVISVGSVYSSDKISKRNTILGVLGVVFFLFSTLGALFLVKQRQETRKMASGQWWSCRVQGETIIITNNSNQQSEEVICVDKRGVDNASGCPCPDGSGGGRCDDGHLEVWKGRLAAGEIKTCTWLGGSPDGCAIFQLDIVHYVNGKWEGLNGCWYIKNNCDATCTPPPFPSSPPSSRACLWVKAFRVEGDITKPENWHELSLDELKNLKPGDKVYFGVGGSGSGIDRARFRINEGVWQEVGRDHLIPGIPRAFYLEYIIPEGVTDFVVEGQLHNPSGWF